MPHTDRAAFDDARRRRGRRRLRRQQARAAHTADVPVLYGATFDARTLYGVVRYVESVGGGWFVLGVGGGNNPLLSTVEFCDDPSSCRTDHRAAARQLLTRARRALAEHPEDLALVRTGGAWPWPGRLPPE